jgi:hypothetical protein
LIECRARLKTTQRVLRLARSKENIRDLLRVASAGDLASDARCFWSVADAFAAAVLRLES